jgi:hypothetical protein
MVPSPSQEEEERGLMVIRLRLLRDRPPTLTPDQGREAFQNHKLLAAATHQAARLDQHKLESDSGAWERYFASYFPGPRNGTADARTLWKERRNSLLKDGAPGAGVLITHGQSQLHWHRDCSGRLCINLEDMWADFELSVDHFIAFLRANDERRAVSLRRAQKFEIDIVSVPVMGTMVAASGWDASLPTASAYAGPRPRLQPPPRVK